MEGRKKEKFMWKLSWLMESVEGVRWVRLCGFFGYWGCDFFGEGGVLKCDLRVVIYREK